MQDTPHHLHALLRNKCVALSSTTSCIQALSVCHPCDRHDSLLNARA
jgi:hypothetical protein